MHFPPPHNESVDLSNSEGGWNWQYIPITIGMPTEMDLASVYQVVLCALLPPVAVWLHTGQCSLHVLLTLFLWTIFIAPGVVYALWFCFFRTLFVNRSNAITSEKMPSVDRNIYF